MDLTFERLSKTALVMLCECPRKDEKKHMHRRPVASGAKQEIEVAGPDGPVKLAVPVTEEVEVQGGVPRIILRAEGDDETGTTSEADDAWVPLTEEALVDSIRRTYAGACRRCGEVFSCTLSVTEAGLREPAPEGEAPDGGTDQGDQS